MVSLEEEDAFVVHVKVEKDKSSDNLVLASIFFLIGMVIFIFLISAYLVKRSEGDSKGKIRGLGVIFLAVGCVLFLLFIVSIFMALLGVALIFTGIELFRISGRISNY